jgi:hypothetical protein
MGLQAGYKELNFGIIVPALELSGQLLLYAGEAQKMKQGFAMQNVVYLRGKPERARRNGERTELLQFSAQSAGTC